MKSIILSICCTFVLSITYASEPPCDCKEYTNKITKDIMKGDFHEAIASTVKLHTLVLSDRVKIAEYAIKTTKDSAKRSKYSKYVVELKNSISKIKAIHRSSKKLKPTKKNYTATKKKIHTASGKILSITAKGMWNANSDDKDPISPPVILPIERCDQSTFIDEDCADIASNIVGDCQSAIEIKAECGYYTQFDSPQEAQEQLNQDINMCNSLAQNQQMLCEQANANCRSYGGGYDMFQFQRAAALACSLKDQLTAPAQTQTSDGN